MSTSHVFIDKYYKIQKPQEEKYETLRSVELQIFKKIDKNGRKFRRKIQFCFRFSKFEFDFIGFGKCTRFSFETSILSKYLIFVQKFRFCLKIPLLAKNSIFVEKLHF